MSRIGLIVGLIISAAFHLWLFRYLPTNVSAENIDLRKSEIATVDVVQVEEPQQRTAEQQLEPEIQSPPESKHEGSTQPIELIESNKELLSNSSEEGDFAGSKDGIERPILRINWGSPIQAVAVLRASGMRLVILGPGGTIGNELVPGSTDLWYVKPLAVEAGQRYSDSLRVVDKVPAFTSAKTFIRPGSGQSLAVLMPIDMEKMIETAKIAYAYQQGLRMQNIATLGGYFSLNNSDVDFMIKKIQLRR